MRAKTTPSPSRLGAVDAVDRDQLRLDILSHVEQLGLSRNGGSPELTKAEIRRAHLDQRRALLEKTREALGHRFDRLVDEFADGSDVDPAAMEPYLEQVQSRGHTADLFRFATQLWSVPVSAGFGRRMRYLVRDSTNGKLIGVFALGDPVFNLRARDQWIGWNERDRRERLVDVMDAYVMGAVPPYRGLLAGKMVMSLIGCEEVCHAFEQRYRNTRGVISRKRKRPKLALVTVTSALGRSSIYNRLKLYSQTQDGGFAQVVALTRVGSTLGYGHFQLTDELFSRLRQVLREDQHAYSDDYRYGNGPNWRMRVLRGALETVGLDPELVRHGVKREVYVMPIATNCRAFLVGPEAHPEISRPRISEVAALARDRWVVPRALRQPEYKKFRRRDILTLLDP